MVDTSPIIMHPYMVYRGIAAEDIAKDTIVLPVICPELMPNAPFGTIGAAITKETISLQNRDGKPIASSVTSANHIVATWEGSSNQRYPAAIRKGEPVEIWRTEGQDKYRWRATASGRDLRATDRLHFEVGATDPTKPGVTKDDTNTYSCYLDSIEKKVGLKTSKANGEATAFSIEADLAAGTFHISDNTEGSGNRIFMDTGDVSGTPVFQVNLSSGVTLKFEGEDAFLKVPGNLFADIGKRAIFNSPLTIVNTDKKGHIIVNAASVAINAAKDIVLTAGKVIGLNASMTKFSGVLAAAKAKITTLVKLPVSDEFKPVTVNDPTKSPPSEPSNSADTNMTGPAYRNP